MVGRSVLATFVVLAGSVLAAGQQLTPVANNPIQSPIVLPAHGVKKPKLIHLVNAKNPPGIGYHRDVSVKFAYTVGTDGLIYDPHILRSGGRRFDSQALLALRQFRYRSATESGVPVAVIVKRGVDFTFPIPDPCDACEVTPSFR
jgi:hypothetical protein